jgi:hypothetical protein
MCRVINFTFISRFFSMCKNRQTRFSFLHRMSKKYNYASSDESDDASFTATSESSSQFSGSYETSDESSDGYGKAPIHYASNLLSNPANQLSCNKEESGEMSKNVSNDISSVTLSSSSEEEEMPVVFLKAPNLVHMSTKMTAPVVTTKASMINNTEMGDLVPVSGEEMSAFKLESVDTLSKKEYDSIAMKQSRRVEVVPYASPSKLQSASDLLVPWSSLSAKEQESMTLKHEARLNAFHHIGATVPSTPTITKNESTGDELVPWTSLNAKEQEVLTLKHQTRLMALASIVSSSSTKKAVTLSAIDDLSQDEVALLKKKQVERPSKEIMVSAMGECKDAADKSSGYPCASVPLASRKYNNVLADIDDLTTEEMRIVLNNREKHHPRRNHKHRRHRHHQAMPQISATAKPMASSTPMRSNALTTKQYKQTNQLANIDSVDAQRLEHLFAPYANHVSAGPLLVNFNTLDSEKQASILRNMETHSFVNQSGTSLSEKRVFESLNASKLMSVGASKLFLGMPLSTLSDNKTETSNVACPNNVLPPDGICGDKMLKHMKKTYPAFTEMITRAGMDQMFNELLHNHDIDYLIIVPNSAMIRAFRGQSIQKIMSALASLMLLVHKGETIPVSASMYSCLTPLDGVRTLVRRKNASTLEIENATDAILDPNSVGRVYRMVEQPSIEDLGDSEEGGEIEFSIDTEDDDEEEEETDDDKNDSTTTTTTTTTTMKRKGKKEKTRVQAEIVETMPTNESDDLSLMVVEEENMDVPSSALTLTSVHHSFAYKNRSIEALCQKMMSPSYNGKSDMANFVDYGKSLGANKATEKKKEEEDSEDTLFLNTLHPNDTEKLGLSGAYEIGSRSQMAYNLDKSLTMRESIMPSNLRIKKSELLNHLCVLSTKNAQNTEYAVAIFSLSNCTGVSSKTDVCMSTDENVLMRFQNNILTSIALNNDASKFVSIAIARRLERKSNMMSLHSGRNCGSHAMHSAIVTHLSMGVKFDKDSFAHLYTKEMKFDAFVGTMLPLSVPSFIKKAEALGRHLFAKVHTLVPSDKEIRLSMYETRPRRDEVSEVLIGIGGGSRDLANNLHTYFFLRKKWEKKDGGPERVYQYQYIEEGNRYNDSRDYGRVDFRKMQGLRTSKTLSVTMKNPFTGKSQNILFKLRNTMSIEKVTRYDTTKGDMIDKNTHVYFLLDKGLLSNFYLSNPNPDNAKRHGVQKSLDAPRKGFEKSIASFLSTEAKAYASFNIDAANMSYLEQRLRSYASRSTLFSVTKNTTYDKVKSLAFFKSLSSEVKKYLDEVIVVNPSPESRKNTAILSPQAQQKMIETSYLIPNESETQCYHTLLTAGFKTLKPGATLATMINGSSTEKQYDTKSVLESVVSHYDASNDGGKNTQFRQYMTRVHYIINSVLASLEK